MSMVGSSHGSHRGGVKIPAEAHAPEQIVSSPTDPTVISQRASSAPQQNDVPTLPGGLAIKGMVGDKLGQFELLEFVGGGGMGAVFRALDTKLNREVALKILTIGQKSDEDIRRRFQVEAQSAARLDHENIARVYQVGEEGGHSFIVFEFIEGTNLRDMVEQLGPIRLNRAVSYVLQIAHALAHASSRQVVHRDIKPSNVIVNPQGKAKLVDMGLARSHQPQQTDLTASGVTLGTFDYISPEQARDPRSADVRSDIYSLGCTFFFAITGRPPFPEGTMLQKLLQHSADEPPDPREFVPGLPVQVPNLLKKMLAKDPRRRFQSAEDLVSALNDLADLIGVGRTEGLRLPLEGGAVPAGRSWIVHLPWVIPVGLFALAMLVLNRGWFDRSNSMLGLPPLHTVAQNEGDDDESPAATQASPDKSPSKQFPTGNQTLGKDAPKDSPNRETRTTDDGTKNAKSERSKTDALPGKEKSKSNNETAGSNKANSSAGQSSAKSKSLDNAVAGELDQDHPADNEDAQGELDAAEGATGEFSVVPMENNDLATRTASNDRENASKNPISESVSEGVRIVTDKPNGVRQYDSLHAACAEAKNGDIIELRFNGPLEERPLTLDNLKLTIRSGEGFHPILVYRPHDQFPGKYPRTMITVVGGRLHFENVMVELDVPSPRVIPTDTWSLIEGRQVELISMERCLFTIRNANDQRQSFHPMVSFLRLRGSPASSTLMEPTMTAMGEPQSTVRLRHCVVRGEAVFLRQEDLQPINLNWENGLLATTESMIVVNGGTQGMSRPTGQVRVDLRHVTANLGGGLLRALGSMSAPLLLRTEFNCTECIFVSGTSSPFVEQTSTEAAITQRQRLSWTGDGNTFDGFQTFWRISSIGLTEQPAMMSFSEWRDYWKQQQQRELNPQVGAVGWKRPLPITRATNSHLPSDYLLDSSPNTLPLPNDPSKSAPPGMDASNLIVVPTTADSPFGPVMK